MANDNNYLLELGFEELPAKSLPKLEADFKALVEKGLTDLQIGFDAIVSYVTPRRVALSISGLSTAQPDRQRTRKGPSLKAAYDSSGAPTPAALGFAKSCGVTIEELETTASGEQKWLAFQEHLPGKLTAEVLPSIVQQALEKTPTEKRMRWGKALFQFIRPLRWIVSLYNDILLPIQIFNIEATNFSYGHRAYNSDPIPIERIDDYENILHSAGKVIAAFEKRKSMIKEMIESTATDLNAQAQIDEVLLNEVCGLTEFPKAILGRFDPKFLEVPQEVLICSMQEHQRYFPLFDQNNRLLPHFITIANLNSRDEAKIIAGNEKVILPRLSDALFFYEQDLKQGLSERLENLNRVTFQESLGSIYDKSKRVAALAQHLAAELGANPALAYRAALLAKADLTTQMVNEFPELQGVMGQYYLLNKGDPELNSAEDLSLVADAIKNHYLPKYANDQLPQELTTICVSIADRIDTLVGLFGIKQFPTGEKDPFALRRAALGVINTLIHNQINLDLDAVFTQSIDLYHHNLDRAQKQSLVDFFSGRYRSLYLETGIDVDVVQSIESLSIADPYDFHCRVCAVTQFKQTEAAILVTEMNKRVSNILKNFSNDGELVDPSLFEHPEEQHLFDQIGLLEPEFNELLSLKKYQESLSLLSTISPSIASLFEKVMINHDDIRIKNNRYRLLAHLRTLFLKIADISILKLA